jgi:hypothetical protein
MAEKRSFCGFVTAVIERSFALVGQKRYSQAQQSQPAA